VHVSISSTNNIKILIIISDTLNRDIFSRSYCHNCGNGIIEGGEECDTSGSECVNCRLGDNFSCSLYITTQGSIFWNYYSVTSSV